MAGAGDVVDLGRLLDVEGDGAHWSLQEPSQLNANVVHLDPGHEVGEHLNREVDVLMVVLSGDGRLDLDGRGQDLAAPAVAHLPRGARRSIRAGDRGLTYLTAHRRRSPLGIGPGPSRKPAGPVPEDEGGDPACWSHLFEDY